MRESVSARVMMPLVAYSYAAKHHRRMEDTIRLSRRLGLMIALISIILYEIFAVGFTRLFIADARTVDMASQVPADPGSGHAADVLKLFYGLSVPGLRQRKDRPVSGCDALAGI